jgi:hypothetical protein
MLFAEGHARWLLIVHAILGAASVAVTTHLVVWTRRYPRGEFSRVNGVRWFATVGCALYVTQFLLGNVLYPTYKVRVRSEYFDLGSAAAGEAEVRRKAREQVEDRRRADALHDGRSPGEFSPAPQAPRDLTSVSRLFDIKEHWAALGLPLVCALCALTWAWRPNRDGPWGGRLIFAFAVAAATCTWISGVIGLWVTSHRAVGEIL